jgi:hypothetical protein
MKTYTHEERCDLIARVASWCFDNTESWERDHIGEALAYLFWAIAAPRSGDALDASPEHSGDYDRFVELLKSNPNGLFDELVEEGFIIV